MVYALRLSKCLTVPFKWEETLASWPAFWSEHGELKCILNALGYDAVWEKSPIDLFFFKMRTEITSVYALCDIILLAGETIN